MDQICSFMFLRNQLSKCLRALKSNRHYRQQKRLAPINWGFNVKSKIFFALQRKWHQNRMVHHFKKIHFYKVKYSIFLSFKETWSHDRQLRMKFINLMRSRDQTNILNCFKALKEWKYVRYQARNNLEDHEKVRASFILRRWSTMVKRRANNLKKFTVLSLKTDDNQVLRYLRAWRTELYMRQMEVNVAVPHFQESLMINHRRNVFEALKDHMQYKLEKKEKIRQSFEYYRFSLMSKALETIKWFNEVEQDRKNKIEFMQLQRNERYARIAFDTIKRKTNHLRQFRARFEQVKKNHIEA